MANIADAIVVTIGREIFSVDVVTGKAMTIATVPSSVGDVSFSGIPNINMLAVNGSAGLVYYTKGNTASTNVELFAYDYVHDKHILIDDDLENNGVTLGNDSGLGGGAAAFHNGNLYLGVDSVQGSNDQIYKISFNATGTTIASATTLGPRITQGGHDWGDIAVDAANNVLLSFTLEFGLQRYNLSTGALINRPVSDPSDWGIVTTSSTRTLQAATDADGHVYVVGMHDIGSRDVPSIRQIDPVTGQPTGSLIDLTTDGVTILTGGGNGLPNDAALLPVATGKIAGTVYYDTDHDNVLDAAEAGRPNTSVELIDDVNDNGVVDAGERILDTVTTDAQGAYQFTGVLPGNFIIRVIHPDNVDANADILKLGREIGNVNFAVNNVVPENRIVGQPQTSEDTSSDLAIQGISIDDFDDNVTSTSLSVLHGSLSVTPSGAATITSGVNGSSAFTVSGSQTDINATLATLRYRPEANFNGDDSLTITSRDSEGAKDTDTVAIQVAPVNDAPAGAPPASLAHGREDQPYTVSAADLLRGFFDIDGDRLSVNRLSASNGSVVDNGGTFTITPSANFHGLVTLTYDVIDGRGGALVGQKRSYTLDPANDAPTVAHPISDQGATEDNVFTFTVPSDTFADVDAGDSLSYRATKADGSALPPWLNFDGATRTFSGTPPNGDVGTLSVKVTATDAASAFVSDIFDITIVNTNDAPTVAHPISDQGATEDNVFTFTVPSDTFADVDAGDSLSYRATKADGSALPPWLNFDGATRTFSGTPANGDVGTLSVKVTATDAASAFVSDIFDITIVNTNDAPTGAPTAVLAHGSEDQPYTVSASDLLRGFSDIEGDTLSAANVSASDGSVTDNHDGTFTITPTANFNGLVTLSYDVIDGNGGTLAGRTRSYTLDPDDDAPTSVLLSPHVQRIVESTPAQHIKIADISIADIDGGAHALALAGPDAANFEIVGSAVFLKARTALDFETKTSYAFAVAVDEGSAPGSDPTSQLLTIHIANASGRYVGTAAANRLAGSAEEDVILGLGGNDVLAGGTGNDAIAGGAGRDVMAGGAGADTFLFKSVKDSTGPTGVLVNNSEFHGNNRPDHRDLITDFAHGTDTINLSAIDANSKLAGNQAFTFAGGEALAKRIAPDGPDFSGRAGELHVVRLGAVSDMTLVEGDTNGDGIADLQILLRGHSALTKADFVL